MSTETQEKKFKSEADAKLFDAVKRLELSEVKTLLAAGGNPNAERFYNGRSATLIHEAISYALNAKSEEQRIEVVGCLLDAGADINGKDGFYRDRTAVFQAAYHGHWKLTPYLIDRGANTALRDRDGMTVFAYFYSLYQQGDRACYEILDILSQATDDGRSWLKGAEGQSWLRRWRTIQKSEEKLYPK